VEKDGYRARAETFRNIDCSADQTCWYAREDVQRSLCADTPGVVWDGIFHTVFAIVVLVWLVIMVGMVWRCLFSIARSNRVGMEMRMDKAEERIQDILKKQEMEVRNLKKELVVKREWKSDCVVIFDNV